LICLGTLPDQDSSNLAVSVPTSVGSRADVPNVKKKHRRIKSTSRASDPCIDAGKCQPWLILLILRVLYCTFAELFLIFTLSDELVSLYYVCYMLMY